MADFGKGDNIMPLAILALLDLIAFLALPYYGKHIPDKYGYPLVRILIGIGFFTTPSFWLPFFAMLCCLSGSSVEDTILMDKFGKFGMAVDIFHNNILNGIVFWLFTLTGVTFVALGIACIIITKFNLEEKFRKKAAQ